MKIKLLFVIDSLALGGAEKSIVALLRHLDPDQYDVDIYTFSRGDILEPQIPPWVNRIQSQKYDKMCTMSLFSSMFYALKYGQVMRYSYRLLNALHCRTKKGEPLLTKQQLIEKCYDPLPDKYDLAFAFLQGLSTYFVSRLVSAQFKVAWIHNDPCKGQYDIKKDKEEYAGFNYIAVPSQAVVNSVARYLNILPKNIWVGGNYIDCNKVIELANMESPVEFSNDKIKIVSVGRMVVEKGYNLTIEACQIIKQILGNRFCWYIIGDGREKESLKALAEKLDVEDCIMFLGEKINPYPYMLNCDLYVQTSISESFCITVEEAKILCKPIIITDFAAANERITNGVNGIIVEQNSETIADAIIRLIKSSELKDEFVNNLKKNSCENCMGISNFETFIRNTLK